MDHGPVRYGEPSKAKVESRRAARLRDYGTVNVNGFQPAPLYFGFLLMSQSMSEWMFKPRLVKL